MNFKWNWTSYLNMTNFSQKCMRVWGYIISSRYIYLSPPVAATVAERAEEIWLNFPPGELWDSQHALFMICAFQITLREKYGYTALIRPLSKERSTILQLGNNILKSIYKIVTWGVFVSLDGNNKLEVDWDQSSKKGNSSRYQILWRSMAPTRWSWILQSVSHIRPRPNFFTL